MYIVGITNRQDSPAGRFRVRQFIRPLRQFGIDLHEIYPTSSNHWGMPANRTLRHAVILGKALHLLASKGPGIAKSRSADLTFLSRELVQGFPTLESLLGKPLVVDVDDAVWLATPFGRAATVHAVRSAAAVTVGNAFLAEWYSRHHRQVHVIPTSVDTDRYFPVQKSERKRFVVGWTGTSSNFPYLSIVERPLAEFLRRHRDTEFVVIADCRPVLAELPPEQFRFVQWTPDVEIATVQEMHVGIMPLEDSEWSRGKCAAKLIQYLACGVPAVFSPIGANLEVLAKGDIGWTARREDEWFDALQEAYDQTATRTQKGTRGRSVVENHYSVAVSAQKLASVFRAAA